MTPSSPCLTGFQTRFIFPTTLVFSLHTLALSPEQADPSVVQNPTPQLPDSLQSQHKPASGFHADIWWIATSLSYGPNEFRRRTHRTCARAVLDQDRQLNLLTLTISPQSDILLVNPGSLQYVFAKWHKLSPQTAQIIGRSPGQCVLSLPHSKNRSGTAWGVS